MSVMLRSKKFSVTKISSNETPRCVFSDDGLFLNANQVFYALIDADETQCMGMSISELFDLGMIDYKNLHTSALDVRLRQTGASAHFYFDWVHAADGDRYLIVSKSEDSESLELEQEDDTIDHLLHRIQASQARIEKKASKAQRPEPANTPYSFQECLSLSHDVMLIVDMDGKIVSANKAFMHNFGFDTASIDAMPFVNLLADEDKQALQGLMQHCDAQSNIDFECRMFTQDGKQRWVEWRQKYQDALFYLSGRDVTDIKQQQADLMRRQRQLNEAEAIGRMGHWYWVIGQESLTWSQEIYRMFGVSEDAFAPAINKLMEFVHKRDIGRVIQAFQRAMIEEKNYDMEFRIIRPDGEIRYIHCEGRCDKDENDDVTALYGIMQDMTQRVLYEQELRKARDSTLQAYAAKSQFLANMSHELRTPLNAIIGFSQMIEQQMLGPIFNEKYLDYASSIKESGEHLLDLISDILDMSKIEAGKHALDLEIVNVCDVLRRSMMMIEGRAKDQQVTLRTPIFIDDVIEINADRRALMQIFLNLLSNAVKFTPPHGCVWIEYQEEKDGIILRVCDTGIGIPAHKLASVLKPFEQVESHYTKEYEGTGLGLSITKELIEMHGGNIHISSTIGIGTTVSVLLPYDAPKAA